MGEGILRLGMSICCLLVILHLPFLTVARLCRHWRDSESTLEAAVIRSRDPCKAVVHREVTSDDLPPALLVLLVE